MLQPTERTRPPTARPLTIRMHQRDNVAIVANDDGLAAGTTLPGGRRRLRERLPRGHNVAPADIAARSSVHERLPALWRSPQRVNSPLDRLQRRTGTRSPEPNGHEYPELAGGVS